MVTGNGKMLTPLSKKLIRFVIKSSHFWGTLPYRSDDGRGRLVVDSSKFHRVLYTLCRVFVATNQCIMCVRVPLALFNPNTPSGYKFIAPAYVICFAMLSLLH